MGLVIETRPDNISEEEVIRLRRFGCTKVQIGIQTLQDSVLELNHRGHDVAATAKAFELLRFMGFKIHGHWMANLYGSTPELDVLDYSHLFTDNRFCPDELKIYPCSLLDTAELMDYYNKGLWKPYTGEELLHVLVETIAATPEYCRLTRIIRDIPSTDIVVGNKNTNLRENAEQELNREHRVMLDIRAREIKRETVTFEELDLDTVIYITTVSTEVFLQFVRKTDHKIAGFLRLSLPNQENGVFRHPFLPELNDCAMIREVHVYGNVVDVGSLNNGHTQHLGLGTQLIRRSKELAREAGFGKLAVISAIGTRGYYAKRGFELQELYQIVELNN